jgi:hypothetical protein
MNHLDERQRLLLRAVFLHGAPPGTAVQANCARVLRQALVWAGLWNGTLARALREDREDPILTAWYGTLIEMSRDALGDPLIVGLGNFGSPTDLAAFPSYTACRLTSRGRELAERLFAEHPAYRA